MPVNILSNTTLSQPCYNINSNVTVTGNTRLTINPGVRLQFAEGTRLFIDESATLIANGTANAPIIFTGQLAVPGFWGGLDMTSRAESQISFAILEYGGGSNTLSNSNIHFYFDGRLSLSNSIIRHSSGYGLQQSNGGLLTRFSGNTIALNEQAPVSIAIDSLDLLSADNVYSGNVTVVGGNRDYIEVRPGTVTTNQIWPALDVDYRMPAGTTNIDAALKLAPGARLVFPAEALLNINSVGTLRALGSLSSPVHFTSVPGTNWAGIQFTFNNNNNIIDHAIIENGGGYASNTQANVGIYGSTSRLTLSNTVLRGSASYGFQFITDNLNLNMRNVTVTGNALTGQIAFDQVGSLDSGSTYTGNASDYIDLWGTAVNSNQTVKNIGVPYYIGYGYLSSVNAALIIEPGVSIVFNSGGGLSITASGTLIADGTPEAPITFTGNQKISGYTDALIGSFGPAALPNQVRITNNILRDSANHAIEVSAGTIVNGDLGTNHFENIAGQNIRINR